MMSIDSSCRCPRLHFVFPDISKFEYLECKISVSECFEASFNWGFELQKSWTFLGTQKNDRPLAENGWMQRRTTRRSLLCFGTVKTLLLRTLLKDLINSQFSQLVNPSIKPQHDRWRVAKFSFNGLYSFLVSCKSLAFRLR